jgi:hypothetical protein
MSILSSVKKAVSSAVTAVKNTVSSIANKVTGSSNSASALQARVGEGLSASQAQTAYKTVGITVPSGTVVNAGGSLSSAPVAKSSSTQNYSPASPYGMSLANGGIVQYPVSSTSKSGGSSLNYSPANDMSFNNSISNLSSNFSGINSPTNAGNINPSLGSAGTGANKGGLPNSNPTIGSVTDAASGNAGDKARTVALNSEYQRQLDAINQNANEKKSILDSINGNNQTREQMQKDLESQYGVDFQKMMVQRQGVQAEIQSITDQYNGVEQAMNQQIAGESSRFGLQDFTNNRIAQIKENAAPELNALSAKANLKSAELAAINDNWDLSQKYIRQAVEDSVADQKDKITMALEYYDLNKDTFDNVQKVYKDSYLEGVKQAQDKLDFDRQKYMTEYTQQMQQQYSTSSNSKLTPAQEKTFEAYKSQISSYKSKDEALKELEKVKFGVIKSIGQTGYDSLVNSIMSSTLEDTTKSWWDKLLGR